MVEKLLTRCKMLELRRTFSKGAKPVLFWSALATLLLAIGPVASWGTGDGKSAQSAAERLSPVDYNFVSQANLGAPFQVDSGRIAEKGATTATIRDYAHLMVVTHIPVVDALNRILANKNVKAPANTLLSGAYDTMISSLMAERGLTLDRDYIRGQVDYQKGNEALFRNEIENGSDPALK